MRTRAALLLCLSLPPAAALGQSTGVTTIESSDLQNGGRNDGVINIAECTGLPFDTQVSFTWTLTGAPPANGYYLLYAMLDACPNEGGVLPTDTTRFVDLTEGFQPIGGATTGVWPASGNLSARSAITSKLGVNCGGTTSTNINLCVIVFDQAQQSIQTARATGILKVDVDRPATPTITDVQPGDSALHVFWTAGSGTAQASRYVASATSAGHTSGSCQSTTTGKTDCRIDGLDVGVQYDVGVQAFSVTNNPSQPPGANTFCVPAGTNCVPVVVEDFWRRYNGLGGREQGGCGGGAGALALAALLPLAPRLRRRRP